MSWILKGGLLGTGIVLVVLGVNVLNGAYSHLTRLDSLPSEPPICLPLDLSARGIYSGHYRRKFDAVLDDQLRLVIAGSPSTEETKNALAGLTALVVLRDESRRVISEQVVGAADFHEWGAYLKSGLAFTLPVAKAEHRSGDYCLSIEVKTPAKGMAGHPHCIIAEYGLSGVEKIPVYCVLFPAGWTALLLGITLLVVGSKRRQQATGSSSLLAT